MRSALITFTFASDAPGVREMLDSLEERGHGEDVVVSFHDGEVSVSVWQIGLSDNWRSMIEEAAGSVYPAFDGDVEQAPVKISVTPRERPECSWVCAARIPCQFPDLAAQALTRAAADEHDVTVRERPDAVSLTCLVLSQTRGNASSRMHSIASRLMDAAGLAGKVADVTVRPAR